MLTRFPAQSALHDVSVFPAPAEKSSLRYALTGPWLDAVCDIITLLHEQFDLMMGQIVRLEIGNPLEEL